MSDDMRSIVRGWLDLLREPERVRASKAALDKALAAAEARGFERALTEVAESFPDGGQFSGARVKSIIRAMQDGQGREDVPEEPTPINPYLMCSACSSPRWMHGADAACKSFTPAP